jgi:hypothetical protein
MIVVTGTKRSGTSMWMQVLKAGGITVLGEAFPRVWEQSIKEANPRGFFESRLRNGIYYRTNPDPKTGAYLPPGPTRKHAAKVFIPGLIRSDVAYLHRVVASVRNWRSYCASLGRLYAMEDSWLAERGDDPETGESRLEQARRQRVRVPPAVEWWFENYDLVRDVATRRYPFHIHSYEAVLADPARHIDAIFAWLGEGDAKAAMTAVAPELRTQPESSDAPAEGADLDPDFLRVFDDYYAAVHEKGVLPAALVNDMNAVQKRMVERFDPLPPERLVR